MVSNTANNSASDSANTRPRLNAYLNLVEAIKNNQQKIALAIGYILVAFLFFGLGKFVTLNRSTEIKIEKSTTSLEQANPNTNKVIPQSPSTAKRGVKGEDVIALDCGGKIKGNISPSGKVYHLPGGAFYQRTVPEMCFDTESQAAAAGFRKSLR